MAGQEAELRFARELLIFLTPRRGVRKNTGGRVRVTCDGTSTLGHVIESLGVPLPEVGELRVDGKPAVRLLARRAQSPPRDDRGPRDSYRRGPVARAGVIIRAI